MNSTPQSGSSPLGDSTSRKPSEAQSKAPTSETQSFATPSMDTVGGDGTVPVPGFDAGADWESSLVTALEQLADVAPLADASLLRNYVEAVAPPSREAVLIELIKLDMSAAAELGQVPWIETYTDALPEYLNCDQVPLSLVMEEQQLRKDLGCPVDAEEYLARFPHLDGKLSQLDPNNVPSLPAVAVEPPSILTSGDSIDDFQVVLPLGRGAFAQVYLARQISMLRLVALKVSQGTGGESQTLARLDHPNIVRVFDQRQLPFGGPHLLYMQYLPGGTLSEVVAKVRETTPERLNGSLMLETIDYQLLQASQHAPERSSVRDWLADASWPMVVAWIGVQLGRALQAAHEQGVLHRDVKPANVLLSSEGIPKLADFNVSTAASTDQSEGVEALGGSIGYMSPEHLKAIANATTDMNEQTKDGKRITSDDVGESADVFSTAVLLWELWQGHRPFHDDASAVTRRELIVGQLDARQHSPHASVHVGGSSERVLEQTLRQALQVDPQDRPQSGAELSARLRLALHPEAALLFDPVKGSLRDRLGNLSPWLVAVGLILLPNIAAGFFNYEYNSKEIIEKHKEMVVGFKKLANTVNSIAFPLGGVLMIFAAKPVADALRSVKSGNPTTPEAINRTIKLCRRAAWIGGALWGVAAIVYPVVLSAWYPSFPRFEAWHLFGSLVICGGVAAVYPFFGLIVLTTLVYYPKLVRRTMQDDQFDGLLLRVRRWSGRYLLAAIGIPLLGLTMLLFSRETMAKYVIGSSVAATAVGLIAAWAAYQCVLTNWDRMADVLSQRRRSVVPGADRASN